MDDDVRNVAWAIAAVWWGKTHRRAAGSAPEATSPEDYADNFWQGFSEEAKAAIAALGDARAAREPTPRIASDRFA